METNKIFKILVVNDILLARKLQKTYLESEGYEVVLAEDGIEALKRIEEDSPDLVLLDIMMPKMDGFQVCRRIKSDDQTRFIPVIMVTSLNELEDKIKGIDAGADDFIQIPFNKLELLARVKALLRIKHLHDELEVKINELANVQEILRNKAEYYFKKYKELELFKNKTLKHGGVFISYSKADEIIVNKISTKFEEDGISHWLDNKDMFPGEIIDEAISEGIQKNLIFLIILTPNSIKSKWVKRELDEAMQEEVIGKKIVIPSAANGLTFEEIPSRLSRKLCVDFNNDFEIGYNSLRKSIFFHLKSFKEKRKKN